MLTKFSHHLVLHLKSGCPRSNIAEFFFQIISDQLICINLCVCPKGHLIYFSNPIFSVFMLFTANLAIASAPGSDRWVSSSLPSG